MNIQDVKRDIKESHIRHLYIFSGEEYTVKKIYIDMIHKCLNAEMQVEENLSDVCNGMGRKYLLERPKLFLVYYSKEFLTAEKSWERIDSPDNMNYVIFIYDNIDKRGKFYKRFSDKIIDFECLSEQILEKYLVKEGCTMNHSMMSDMIDVCNYSYGRMLYEYNKVKIYSAETHYTQDKSYSKLRENHIISRDARDTLFSMIDAVMRHNKNLAYELKDEAIAFSGQQTVTIISLPMLFKSFEHLYQYLVCNSSDVAKSTGMTGFEIKQAKERAGYFGTETILRNMRLIQETEEAMKIGRMPMEIVLDYIFSEVFSFE